jgi:O-antigen biosynthesis protein
MKTSVIIATHQRPESLRRLVASLAPQFRSVARELLVAENGSVRPVTLDDKGVPILRIHDPRPGKCRVQNLALQQASGEIIVFLDDDLVVSDSYLGAVEDFFANHPEFAAMKGRTLPAEDPATKASAMAPYLDLPISDHGEDVCEVAGVLGANMAFRAAALKQVGPFDERLGPGACGHEEETEMSARLRRAGFRIGYAPKALVYHEVDATRADRDRFIRIARERGRCRMLHEHHSAVEVIGKNIVAWTRLKVARAIGAPVERIAREERRQATARGMFDGLGG